MGEAIRLANELGLDAIWDRIQQQATLLRARLPEVPGVTVTDVGAVQSGIVSFTMEGMGPDEIQRQLHEQKNNVTTSSVSSTRFDMEDRGLEKVVRSSVHYLTTDEEIDRLVTTLRGLR
jgi:selenocysteine lyase/cysteine desulfurase